MDIILAKMQAIVDRVVKDFKKDFEYDIEELTDFQGCFIWSPRSSGTHLMSISYSTEALEWLFTNKLEKYLFGYSTPQEIMKNRIGNFDSDIMKTAKEIYFYDGVSLNKVTLDQAKQEYKKAVDIQLGIAIGQGCPVIV